MAITLYGIRNCDTVKKARAFLDAAGVAYTFHDFKKAGLSADVVERWLDEVPLERLVNRRGTTWRALSDAQRDALSADTAPALCAANPSLVKRPVVQWGPRTTVGFDADSWTAQLSERA
ncbi:MAG: arsenate reductase [Pseudomonadota bacterium]